MAEAGRRCRFWLPKKKRFCANLPHPNSSFCGNHTARSDSEWIPCPIDPSHSVLQENLESHCKRCPFLKQALSLSLQPYYQNGINAGNDEEDGASPDSRETAVPLTDSSSRSGHVSSEMKRNAVYSLTLPRFYALIDKIKSLHESVCKDDIQDSYRIPEACDKWVKREVDRKIPFQEKHVMQQVSILGNMEHFGVLKNSSDEDGNEAPAVVEFGAGRGYLTQLLADCYGIRRVFLVERKSYKLKADRSLRQKESLVLERLRIDIEDLNLNSVESLRGLRFMAIGKHLCGPATDLTLRCCLGQHVRHDAPNCSFQGIAIASCCHHLCQWKQYINKKYLRDLGIGREEFHAITWFTSWAVDADHGSDLPEISESRIPLPSMEKEEHGGEVTQVEEAVRSLKPAERAVLGFMCKQIIDVGRVMWLRELGLDSHLIKYVPPNISPENHLLIARKGPI